MISKKQKIDKFKKTLAEVEAEIKILEKPKKETISVVQERRDYARNLRQEIKRLEK